MHAKPDTQAHGISTKRRPLAVLQRIPRSERGEFRTTKRLPGSRLYSYFDGYLGDSFPYAEQGLASN